MLFRSGCRRVESGEHPDLLRIAPKEESKLQQITVDDIREACEQLVMTSYEGRGSVAVIHPAEAMNVNAANSLLKTLEEPPSHLILIMTARNPYDLLITIRSRSVPFALGRLGDDEMRAFTSTRKLDHAERRLALADGLPGVAVSLDLEAYDRRRESMLALLGVASGAESFGA